MSVELEVGRRADPLLQGLHHVPDVVVGARQVEGLAVLAESDVGLLLPRAEVARCRGEVRRRFETEIARVVDRAEDQVPDQVERRLPPAAG